MDSLRTQRYLSVENPNIREDESILHRLVIFISLKAAKSTRMIVNTINSCFFSHKFEVFLKTESTILPNLVEKCVFNN